MGTLVWLASYPKSGNTWVRAFLHNLIHDRGGAFDLNALPLSVKSDADRADFARLASRPLEELGHAGIAAMRAPVQRAIARAATGPVLMKTHSALTMVGGHASHAVDVTRGAVYLVRDPRDVAVSYADHLGIGVDRAIDILATLYAHTDLSPRHVTEFPGSWSQNVATWTAEGNERVHIARYEDLLADPEARFTEIVAFLGLKPEPETFRRALANTAFRELSRQERRSGFAERSHRQKRFFRKGSAGSWRQVLTAGQAARIVADHGEQMARFGYGDG